MHRDRYEPHLEQLREQLLERRDAMLGALEQHFEGATWTKPEGGLYVLLTLPPGTNAKELVELAVGAEAAPGADFMGLPQTLRLLNLRRAAPLTRSSRGSSASRRPGGRCRPR